MDLWLPDRELIRPPGLSRRGFLRALGVTAAVVAVPGLAVPAPRTVVYLEGLYMWKRYDVLTERDRALIFAWEKPVPWVRHGDRRPV